MSKPAPKFHASWRAIVGALVGSVLATAGLAFIARLVVEAVRFGYRMGGLATGWLR